MRSHGNYLGHNLSPSPLYTEYLRKFLQIDGRGLPNAVHSIPQPRHAQTRELLIEELFAQLRGQQRDIFNDRLSYPPRFILRKLDDGR